MTDVINSTQAIADGRYKEVNTAGSLAAMAISNITGDMQFPFLFGGDGMTYLLPQQLMASVDDILVDTREMVKNVFGLELRVGKIQISELKKRNTEVRLARFQVSPHYTQAIIGGSGIDLAEKLLKRTTLNNQYLLSENLPSRGIADFSGFTCRWEDIPSSAGETISVIVRARAAKNSRRGKILSEVLSTIEEIFGVEEQYHPLRVETQKTATAQAYREARVYSGRTKGPGYALRYFLISMEMMFMNIVEALRLPLKRGGKYFRDVKLDNVINSDFRKFDGTLKMVISCSREQRERFEKHLEDRKAAGELFYGIHVSDRALITCMVQFGSGEEVHFIDAADGGYASAAIQLKNQMGVLTAKPA